MADKKDYYESLGVNKSASKDEIKSAYRKLAKKYHPDNKETGDEKKFKEIQEAYDILYDDKKRATYDQFGHAAFENTGAGPGAGNPFSGFGGGFSGFEGFANGAGVDLDDILGSFFGGGRKRSQGQNNAPQRGADVIMRVKINFMDAINGRDIDISFNYDEVCNHCHGSGAKDASSIKKCPQCGGLGRVRTQQRTIFGVMEGESVCPVCGGKGVIIEEKCPDCGGKGYTRIKKNQKVHIPAGINAGQQIRIAGMGEIGANMGPHGDMYVEVIVADHEYFKRERNDIHIEIPIDFVDAILGTEIEVPTVYGEKIVTVPSGTQPGTILRMKGQGVIDLRGGKPGDQYVHLEIKLPTNVTREQKDLLNQYKKSIKPSDSFFDKFKKAFRK